MSSIEPQAPSAKYRNLHLRGGVALLHRNVEALNFVDGDARGGELER